jgi:fumarate reductase subunit C
MGGWWRRDPFFVRYMIREATAVLVVAYAAVLLVGVIRLAQGEAAYGEWLEFLRSPLSIALHIGLLLGFLYHTWSWFRIMPKTMPMLVVAGRRVGPALITGGGLAISALLCLALFAVTWGLTR